MIYSFNVRTYQRRSKFCFVVVLGVIDIAQNTALLSNFTMLSAYCTIAFTYARLPCPTALPDRLARPPCPAALPGSLARQPCPAALPGSLAWQPCPAALPSSLARQPCPAALPCSLALQPCQAAMPGSLARQPCRNITSLITGHRPAELQAFFRPYTFTGRRPAAQFKLFPQLTRHCDFEPCVQIDA
jgi:hypothetical protein